MAHRIARLSGDVAHGDHRTPLRLARGRWRHLPSWKGLFIRSSIRLDWLGRLQLLVLLGFASLAGCSGGGGGGGGAELALPLLRSVEVSPANPFVAAGTSAQLKATAIYTDNSNRDVTAEAAWTSGSPAVATVGARNGKAVGVAPGTSAMTATFGGQAGHATLTVTSATVARLEVTPATASVATGTQVQFAATGVFTDNSTQDLTADVDWTTSASSIATIGAAGRASGLAQGETTITATCRASTCGAASGSAILSVTAAALQSIAVTPSAPSLALGTSTTLVATGTYSDNSVHDLSDQVTWQSGTASVATVSNAAGTHGAVQTLAVGSTAITASLRGVMSPSINLTVTPATLASITVTPVNPSVAAGLTQGFAAVGTFTDQSTQDLTDQVTWASGNTAVATISNAGGSHGQASATAIGTSSITAAMGLVTSLPATLTVTPATLVSMTVTPSTASVASGATQSFTASGIYTDGSIQDLTATATWASSVTTIATVSNAAGSKGLATGGMGGSATITAQVGSVSASGTLTVQPTTFSTVGAYTWTVLAGVTAVQIVATGGGGGGGVAGNLSSGGNGGRVTATLTVTPGDVLDLFVGGGGGQNLAGGGGGATTVNAGASNQIIAGGGGGAGFSIDAVANGGDGGGNGTDAGAGGTTATGGRGGSGGVGGAGGPPSPNPGMAGGSGNGGIGGVSGLGAAGGLSVLGAGIGGSVPGGASGGGGGGGGSGGGGYGGGGSGTWGGINDGGGGGGGSTGPAGAVFTVGANGGVSRSNGGDGSISISIAP